MQATTLCRCGRFVTFKPSGWWFHASGNPSDCFRVSWEIDPTHVETPDGPGVALVSENGAEDVVRVRLDSSHPAHPGYCYPRDAVEVSS